MRQAAGPARLEPIPVAYPQRMFRDVGHGPFSAVELLLPPGLADQVEEFAGLDTQSVCDPAEDRNAHRNVCPLNSSDVAATDPRPFGELFLRQLTFMPQAAQICGQDILEIHDRHKRHIGTIDPGTIVPIRGLICYSDRPRVSLCSAAKRYVSRQANRRPELRSTI